MGIRAVVVFATAIVFLANFLLSAFVLVVTVGVANFFCPKWLVQRFGRLSQLAVALQIRFVCSWICDLQIVTVAEDKYRLADHVGHSNHIVVMNHRSELDFCISWIMSNVFGVSEGTKVCVKEELRRVPILGWYWEAMDFIFVHRDWEKDEGNLKQSFDRCASSPHQFTLLIFCEGTRLSASKLRASNEYARQHGLKELQHHLIPRTRGFGLMLDHLKTSVDAVYDLSVVVDGPFVTQTPTAMQMLFGHPLTAFTHIRRYPVAEIPTDAAERANWLHRLYEEKDEIVDYYLRNGCFATGRPRLSRPPASCPLVAVFFLVFVSFPIFYWTLYVCSCFFMLPTGVILALVLLFALGLVGVGYKVWCYVRLKGASSYGLDKSAQPQQQYANNKTTTTTTPSPHSLKKSD